MVHPPGQGGLFDLVPQVKPLDGPVGSQDGPTAVRMRRMEPEPLPVEGHFVPPVNYVSDEEEP